MFALPVYFFLELAILQLETVKFPFSSFFVHSVVSPDLYQMPPLAIGMTLQ